MILHSTLLLTCFLTKIQFFSQNVTLFPFFSGLCFCVLLIWLGLLLSTAPMVYSGTALFGLYLSIPRICAKKDVHLMNAEK